MSRSFLTFLNTNTALRFFLSTRVKKEPRIDIVEPGSTIFIAVVSFTSETALVLFDGQGQLRYKSSGRDQPLRVLQSTRAGLASRPNLLQRTVIGDMPSDKRTFVDGLQTPSAKSQLDAPRIARGISKMQSSERPTLETTRTRLRRLPVNWRGPLGGLSGIPEGWQARLAWRDEIVDVADRLYKASFSPLE